MYEVIFSTVAPNANSPNARKHVFFPRRQRQCVSSNPIVLVIFEEPIAGRNYAFGSVDGEARWVPGETSEYQKTITFDVGELSLEPFLSKAEDHYFWNFHVWVDNCATGYTWSDDFFRVLYEDEETTIDLSPFFDVPYIPHYDVPDTGVCREYSTYCAMLKGWRQLNCCHVVHSIDVIVHSIDVISFPQSLLYRRIYMDRGSSRMLSFRAQNSWCIAPLHQ